MQHDQLIGAVQHRAQLASRGEAERAVRATLETLGERIPDGLADHLAAGLPHEVGEHLRRTELVSIAGTGERFDRHEFIARVATRAGSDPPRAAYLARTVLEVVEEASSGSVMDKVREALPSDIRQLVSAGSTGSMHNG